MWREEGGVLGGAHGTSPPGRMKWVGNGRGSPSRTHHSQRGKGVVRGQVHRGAREWLKDVITAS